MIKTILALLLIASAPPTLQESRNIVVKHRSAYVAPTFVSATNTPEAMGSSNSATLTVAAGDFVFLTCRGSSLTGLTFTSVPSNTFVLDTFGTATLGTMQLAHAFSVAGGSTTFSCNVTDSELLSIIVMRYTPGSLTTTDTHTGPNFGSFGPSNAPTTGPFTTAAHGLIIACTQVNGTAVFTAGAIGSGSGTIRQTSTGSACEDNVAATAQSGITAAMSLDASHDWIISADTFK